jgi:hypothetical protein
MFGIFYTDRVRRRRTSRLCHAAGKEILAMNCIVFSYHIHSFSFQISTRRGGFDTADKINLSFELEVEARETELCTNTTLPRPFTTTKARSRKRATPHYININELVFLVVPFYFITPPPPLSPSLPPAPASIILFFTCANGAVQYNMLKARRRKYFIVTHIIISTW